MGSPEVGIPQNARVHPEPRGIRCPGSPPAGSRAPVPQGMRTALRLVRFRGAAGERPRLGLEVAPGGDLVDLSAAEPELPRSMREFLELGPRGLALAQRWVIPKGGCCKSRHPQQRVLQKERETRKEVSSWIPAGVATQICMLL